MATTESPAEQRMNLHHVSWDAYQRLLRDYENSSAPCFTNDRGTLEIMTPLWSGDRYLPAQSSRAVPILTADALTGLVRASRGLSQAGWLRLAREGVSSRA
jgi:hypothetical protein